MVHGPCQLDTAHGHCPDPNTIQTLHSIQDIEQLADSMSLEKHKEIKSLIFSFYNSRDASGQFGLSLE